MTDQSIDTLKHRSKNRDDEVDPLHDLDDTSKSSRIVIDYSAKNQTTYSYIISIITFLLLTGLFYALFVLLLYCLYHIIFQFSIVHLIVVISLLLTTQYRSTVVWPEFINLPIWKHMSQYLSFKVIIDKVKIGPNYYEDWYTNPDQQYLFIEHPHGVIPFGFIMSSTVVQQIWPGIRVEGGVATALFRLPLVGHLCHWFGSRPASPRNINKIIDEGKSVGILAGGIAELFLTSRDVERVYIKKRTGFVKIALQRGMPIVPVYYFGHSQLYDFVGASFLKALSRRLGVAAVAFYGRFYTPIPYQYPVTMVVGTPIAVEKNENPSEEQIQELHDIFVRELKKLFDKHKGEFGWSDRQLEIH